MRFHKSRWFILLIIGATSFAVAADTGVIRGQVSFAGTIPVMEALKVSGDSFCEDFNAKNPIMKEEVIVNPNRTLKNVAVWISKGGPDRYLKSTFTTAPAVLTQQGCEFYPHVLTVRVGQPLMIQNFDPTIHNINAFPKKNDRFNKALIPGGDPVTLVFDKPEVAIRVQSDIHPWMVAYVAVLDRPGYTVTGDDGTFEFPNLPPGEYIVDAWHEKYGSTSVPVVVKADDPCEIEFTYTWKGSSSGTQTGGKATSGTQTGV